MKQSFTILVLTLVNPCWSINIFNPAAITRFEGLEKLFAESFFRQSISSATSTPSPRWRKSPISMQLPTVGPQFCERLMSNSFFEMKRERFIDTTLERVIDEIREYYPNTFENMYAEREAFCFRHICTRKYTLESHPIYVYEMKYMIRVYRCHARDLKTREIKQYFISDEYNLRSGSHNASSYSKARFIFQLDRTRGLAVHALVEEPAWSTEDEVDVEKAYLNPGYSRKRYKDLMCTLDQSEKLRLCTSVMNSIRYKSRIVFRPTLYYVGQTCVRRKISFLKHEIADGVHKAWTISCRGKSATSGRSLTYYLSLGGYSVNPVYVLKKVDDKFYLDHYAEMVPVLMERERI